MSSASPVLAWPEPVPVSSLVEGQVRICCAAGIDCPHNLPPLPQLSDSSLMPAKLKRGRREVLGDKQWWSLEERGGAHLRQPKLTRWVLNLAGTHPAPQSHLSPMPLESPLPIPPSRSRTYEPSCKETEQAATGRQGPPSPSVSLGVVELRSRTPAPAPAPRLDALLGQGPREGLSWFRGRRGDGAKGCRMPAVPVLAPSTIPPISRS